MAGVAFQIRGNIPACAGKTAPHAMRSAAPQEHPRVRGENAGLFYKAMLSKGTSPRARGKLLKTSVTKLCIRNIPACAGKTCKRVA